MGVHLLVVTHITHLQVSLDHRVCNHFLLLVFDEDVEKLHVPLVGGLKDLSRGIGASCQGQELRGHGLTLLASSHQILGALFFL